MGLTHYFRSGKLPRKKFSLAGRDCQKVCEEAERLHKFRLVIAYGMDAEPDWGPGKVMFNGQGLRGHEDFAVSAAGSGPHGEFCKTERKPYDLAVRCCLVVFKEFFREKFKVRSDDECDHPDWEKARQLCQSVLGYGGDFRLDQRKYEWRFVGAGVPAGRFVVTTQMYPRNLRVQQALLRNGWTVRKHGTSSVCSLWDAKGERLTFRNHDKAGAQFWAARLFLLEEFDGAPGLEEFVGKFTESEDWTVLAVWADYLADHGERKKERLLRELLPRSVPGSV